MISNKLGQKGSQPGPSTTKIVTHSTTTTSTKPSSSSTSTKENKPLSTGTSSKPIPKTTLNKTGKNEPVEETKTEKANPFAVMPTAKLRSIKTSDPFATKGSLKTNSFAYVYNAGGIPCRIDHGSVNNRLKWNSDVNLEDISFDPLLITCFEGLIETTHPFNFIAKEAIKELLQSQDAAQRAIPLLPRLINPLRTALGSANDVVFENALNTLKQLSDTSGDALNEHLNGLLGNLVKRTSDKKFKERIIDVLHSIEENGGPSIVKTIKAKIPTYTSLC